jgi:hypothetical protein
MNRYIHSIYASLTESAIIVFLSYRQVRKADNLITFMCRLSRNLGASNSWNPKGLSRSVMGLLYLLFVRDLPEDGHGEVETCRRQTVK